MEEMLDTYKKVNKSFSKKVTYRIGDTAGFFSEYNNMILMMAYALEHHFSFALSSLHANFSHEKGWTDYFLPFCPEDNSELQLLYNRRPNRISRPFLAKWLYKLGIMRVYLFDRPFPCIVKKYGRNQEFLMQDLFHKIRRQNISNIHEIPEMQWKGNIREISQKLIDITWRFNEKVKNVINFKISQLNLPVEYVSLHVRWGDKVTECDRHDVEVYMEKLKTYSDCRHVFVATDDYIVLEKLRELYPSYIFYTLCGSEERGYVHDVFVKLSSKERESAQLALWASIEILAKSKHFVGTFSSNIGMYLGMRMSPERCHGIDFEKWVLW